MNAVRRAGRDLLDFLLDRRCAGCGGGAPREREVCDACDALVPRTGTALCLHCLHGDPPGPAAGSGACAAHGSRRILLAGPLYEAPLDRIIPAFKYDGARRLAGWLASLLPEPPELGGPFGRECILVPVSLHPARRARRGFDQSLLLAKHASARWGVPVVEALERVRDHAPQAHLDRPRRLENVREAFRVRAAPLIRDRPVLLVDDVATTGSTLLEAAAVLERAGAAWILGLAASHGAAGAVEPASHASVAASGRVC